MHLNRRNDQAEEETSVDMVLVSPPHNPTTVAVNGNHGGPEGTLLEEPEERDVPVLETLEERRGRRLSLVVLYVTSFNVCVGFSIVLTGVWPYLRQLEPGVSKDMLGWVIAANPIGQMIASPLLGLWSNWTGSNRTAFIATMALFSLGNVLYAMLSMFGTAALAVMITSRFIVGISAANITLVRSYISAATTVRERTTAVSLTSAAQAIGFIIGPAIQTALAVAFSEDTVEATNSSSVIVMEEEIKEASVSNTSIQWNMYTATGWISCFLGLFNLVLFLPCIYQEYSIAAKEAHYQKRAANDETSKLPNPDYTTLFGTLFTFFIAVMIYVLLETLMVPMCMDLYAWTDEMAITVVGTGLSIAAILCFLTFIAVSFITKVIDERIVLIASVLAMVAGMIILIPMGSTYPKIKNCTFIDPLTSHVDESPLLSMPSSDISKGNASDILNHPTTTEGIAMLQETFNNKSLLRSTATPEIEVFPSIPLEINSSSRTLRRQLRHALPSGECEDTGCPPEQEWCLNTPIIERSQLGVGSFFAVMGYPVAFTLSGALYSKILGPKPQGLWMGLLISVGSLSRATGPILVSYIYTEFGTRWTFSILACAMFSVFVIDVVMYKRMVPMNVLKKR